MNERSPFLTGTTERDSNHPPFVTEADQPITIHCTGVTGDDVMTLSYGEFGRWVARMERYGFALTQDANGTNVFSAGGAAEYRWK